MNDGSNFVKTHKIWNKIRKIKLLTITVNGNFTRKPKKFNEGFGIIYK
jgi:hypothetical protein